MKFFFGFILFVLFGCAKPNYQDINLHPYEVDKKNYQLKMASLPIQIKLTFDQVPNGREANTFLLQLENFDAAKQQEIDFNVAVKLWMPSMGHGSSPVKVEKIAPGLFKVTQVYFIMSGDWEIRIQIKDKQTGQLIEQVVQALII